MPKKPNNKKNKDDLVLTPGGFRPKSSVKQVGLKEVVRRSKDGTYTIIQREEIPNDKMKSKNKH
jgi:hypothetical protein